MNTINKKGFSILLILSLIVLIISCHKSDNPPAPTVVKQWDVVLNSKFENPAPAGRTETGTGGTASGTVPVSAALADSIKTGEVYLNVHSTQFGGGLLRGQLNDPVDFAIDVPLVGANEVPAVNTTATGLALLRLKTDKNLYSKVTVTNLEVGDTLKFAHIHGPGAVGVNAPVIITLCPTVADFGVVKKVLLPDSLITDVKTWQVYVNAHSKLHGGGIIRGQIR